MQLISFGYQQSIKGSEAQKQRPHELLWMLWFDEKSISSEAHKKCDSSSSIAVLKGEKIGVFQFLTIHNNVDSIHYQFGF